MQKGETNNGAMMQCRIVKCETVIINIPPLTCYNYFFRAFLAPFRILKAVLL